MSGRGTRAKAAEREFRGDKAACPWCQHQFLRRWDGRKVFQSGSREARRALKSGRAKIVSNQRHDRITQDRVVCAHPCHTK